MEQEDRWYSVEEICKHLHVSKETIYNWLKQEGMPGYRIKRKWLFQRSEVDTWFRAKGENNDKAK